MKCDNIKDMKQHITKEQWDEISLSDKANFKHYPVSIGDMIEFLGDGWVLMLRNSFGEKVILNTISNDLLCSFLWNAVKYKIK